MTQTHLWSSSPRWNGLQNNFNMRASNQRGTTKLKSAPQVKNIKFNTKHMMRSTLQHIHSNERNHFQVLNPAIVTTRRQDSQSWIHIIQPNPRSILDSSFLEKQNIAFPSSAEEANKTIQTCPLNSRKKSWQPTKQTEKRERERERPDLEHITLWSTLPHKEEACFATMCTLVPNPKVLF